MAVDKKHKSCEERIDEKLKRRIELFKGVMESADADEDGKITTVDGDEYENIHDWLSCNSLSYEDDPHYRAKNLLLSWGGPSDGFRFFEDGTIQYYFQDWFDGAIRELYGKDKEVMQEFYDRCLDFGG